MGLPITEIELRLDLLIIELEFLQKRINEIEQQAKVLEAKARAIINEQL